VPGGVLRASGRAAEPPADVEHDGPVGGAAFQVGGQVKGGNEDGHPTILPGRGATADGAPHG
jgi:hypothetical protein